MQSEGYITEVRYVWGYFDEMSPRAINEAAWASGHAGVALGEPFRYLELGCGFGLSAASFAAMHPHATFHGVDLNPQHVEEGQGFAHTAGLRNLVLEAASFEQVLAQQREPYDFIALHGVYSWVSDSVRTQIHHLISRLLRPGGMLYISYNALPGWSPSLPFRTMLLSYVASAARGSSVEEQLQKGMTYLKFLRDNEAGVFRDNPKAQRKLDRLLSQSPNYLIHEFLNEHWRAFYFHEVAAALSACGMRFAGCIPHTRNYPDLCVPATFQPLLRSAETRDTYETHRDFVLDEVFRRDVYVRADQVRPTSAATAPWADAWFGANPLVTSNVPITNPLAQRLLDRLQAAPATTAELVGEAPAEVLQGVLQRLCALGALRLYHGPFTTVDARGSMHVTDGFNRALLRDRLMRDNGVRLVSPHTGAVVPLDVLDGLCVTAWEQPSDERATSIAQALTNAGRHLLEEGQPVTDVAQTLARIETRMSTFETRILPVLTTHQIVTPTSD